MKLKPEVLAAMVELEASCDTQGCSCNHPNACPPCSYCTHPGHPYALEVEDSWESPEDYAAYWATRARAARTLRDAGLTEDRGVVFEWYDKRRGFTVGHGWCEHENKPFWYAKKSAPVHGGNPAPLGWRQDFDTVEAALAFGVVESASQPQPKMGLDWDEYPNPTANFGAAIVRPKSDLVRSPKARLKG